MICFLRSEEPTVVYQQGPSTWSLCWSRCPGRWQSLRQPCCCCSAAKWCSNLDDPMDCSMPGFPVVTISWILFKPMYIELVMPSNHLILCCWLLLLSSILPSIRVFSNESVLCRTKYWSFSFSIMPSSEYSGLIPLGLTGLISLLSMGLSRVSSSATVQKVLILWHLAFFLVQLSHLCITTGKTIALTILTFVGKIMSLLFNMLYSI